MLSCFIEKCVRYGELLQPIWPALAPSQCNGWAEVSTKYLSGWKELIKKPRISREPQIMKITVHFLWLVIFSWSRFYKEFCSTLYRTLSRSPQSELYLLSYVRHKILRPESRVRVCVRLAVHPLCSETGWIGDLWLNCIFRMLEF